MGNRGDKGAGTKAEMRTAETLFEIFFPSGTSPKTPGPDKPRWKPMLAKGIL